MQRKKICGLLVCLLAFVATNAFGQYWGDVGDFEYTGDDGVITITGYNGAGGAIVIPDTVIGMPVESIGTNAFREITTITSVTIPEGVININASAFLDCTGLTSVTLPDSLEEIGGSAFARTGLTSITIPEFVAVINGSVFSKCTDLTSVDLPDNATSIGASAFANTGLASITIPDKVTTISSAFKNCAALTSVNIPALVDSLSTAAFDNCTSLTSITVDPANANFTSIDGVVYDELGETLIIFPTAKSGAFSIPDGVTTIGKLSFNKTTAVTDLTIPESVTTIARQAFYSAGITSVNVPASVTAIQAQAFRGCPNLTSITVDPANTVYSNADDASSADALYSIDGTTLIQYPCGVAGAFSVPSGVTTIPAHAFSESPVLTSVTFSDTVTSINVGIAFDTPSITEYIVDEANPSFSSLDGVLYNKDQTTLLLAPKGIAGAFIIPDGVTELADGSFVACELLTSVTIPDSVLIMNGGWMTGSFSNAIGLTSVTIPDSVTTLVGPTFYGCKGLTSIHIGSGVTAIGNGILWETAALEEITVDPANANFSSSDGVMYDKSGTKFMYFPLARVGAFTVPDGVISIEASALRAAHFITEVTLPDSVTTLNNYCLSPMDSLTTVNMGNGLETIERGALRNNTNLTSVIIPESVTKIVKQAFQGNWRMSSAYFPGDSPVMGDDVFSGTAADFHVCYSPTSFGFLNPWNGYRAYPEEVCDDPFGDGDDDSIENYLDNCLNTSNSDQGDYDNDTLGDACDNCPDDSNYDQQDTCEDGTGDACRDNTDNDTFPDACDNCPDDFNPLQGDIDNNGIGNICEEGPPCYVHVEISSDPYEATEALDNDCNGIDDTLECPVGTVWNGASCVECIDDTDCGDLYTCATSNICVTFPLTSSVTEVTLKGPGDLDVIFELNEIDIARIELTGTTEDSSLTIKTKLKKNFVYLSELDVAGSLKSIKAKAVVLTGALTATGGIAKIQIAGTEAGSSIEAEWIDKLTIKGDFAGHVDLTGEETSRKGYTLGKASIKGSLLNSIWQVSGDVGSVKVGAWGAGSILAVGVEPGNDGQFFTNDDVVSGGSLGKVKFKYYDTDNGGDPFGIISDDYLKLKTLLPVEEDDFYIWER